MRGTADLQTISVQRSGVFREVVAAIDAGRIGIAVVVDEQGRLLALFTDGDVRRAFLAGFGLQQPTAEVVAWRAARSAVRPVQAPAETSRRALLEIMQREVIRHVPLHDADGRLVGIVTLTDLALPAALAPHALIMAGGFGKRMGALTATTPKPLLPVAGTPLIERLVVHLGNAGISRIHVSVHHLAEQIIDHLGDGSRFDVAIDYVREAEPLGTAGAVGLLPPDDATLLVMNGDLLTDIDIRAMVKFHRDAGAWLTMGVRTHEQQVPFGVVECDGLYVHRVQEKPSYRHLVNAGIYLLEPEACATVTPGRRCDMPDVVDGLLVERRRVVAFPIRDHWLDVGRPDDYARAQSEAARIGATPVAEPAPEPAPAVQEGLPQGAAPAA